MTAVLNPVPIFKKKTTKIQPRSEPFLDPSWAAGCAQEPAAPGGSAAGLWPREPSSDPGCPGNSHPSPTAQSQVLSKLLPHALRGAGSALSGQIPFQPKQFEC